MWPKTYFGKIKIINESMIDMEQNNIYGKEYFALILESNEEQAASFNNGFEFPAIAINKDGNNDFAITEKRIPSKLFKQVEVKKSESDDEKEKEINRDELRKGYAVVPVSVLDKNLSKDIDDNQLLSAKDIIAMTASSMIEVNKGDKGPSSLNKKLYMAIGEYADYEMMELVK